MRGIQRLPNAEDESDPSVCPERNLMVAVIVAAINDALGASAARDSPSLRAFEAARARAWFANNSRDFQSVCVAAGYEPDAVRTAALAYIDEMRNTPASRPRGLSFQALAQRRKALEAA